MNVLADSFSVFLQHWQLVVGIVLMMSVGQVFLGSALRMIFRDRLTSGDYFSLSVAGWILSLVFASVLWFVWGNIRQSTVSPLPFLLIVMVFALVLFARTRREPVQRSNIVLWILIALFSVFLFLRLAFVSNVIIPLYFDSAQHYLIIKNLLRSFASEGSSGFGWPTGAYYHVGFHLLAACMASTLGADISDTILILGQMIVAAIPLSVYPILRNETQSNYGALFAVLLAAIGWYMPAYAVNWGKYPALASLPLLTFVIALAYLALRYKDVLSKNSFWWIVLLVSGIIVTGMSHSRSLIVLGIVAFASGITIGWEKLSKLLRFLSFFMVLAGIIAVILFIRTREVFGLLFDPYWEKGLFITATVLFLAVFAQWRYPRLAFASMLVILFLLGGLLIPIRVPGYGNLTLLDRPFVEMILYLPLSILGGAGLGGLEKSVQLWTERWRTKRLAVASILGVAFLGLLVVNAFLNYNLYPADCCEIVGRDDLVAIDWIDKTLPARARILIASTELRVLDSPAPQGAAGGDAGIWITPLTDRRTIALSYQSDFGQPAIFDTICKFGAEYIYVGETGATFNNALLTAHPDRYKVLLSMPKTKVYQVTGCAQPQ